jgi:hypothetical protein
VFVKGMRNLSAGDCVCGLHEANYLLNGSMHETCVCGLHESLHVVACAGVVHGCLPKC